MLKDKMIKWIQDYFETSASPQTKAIIGISGGKDSTITAKLCVEALGADRVVGVMLPYGDQANLQISKEIGEYLGIQMLTINIESMAKQFSIELSNAMTPSAHADLNLLPRLRMTALYYVAQTMGGRVSNNCNLSETVMGYSTLWGDATGDFSLLSKLTVTELLALGDSLGIPRKYVYRTPQDDLNLKEVNGETVILSDEDVLGIMYADLDVIIREGKGTASNLKLVRDKYKATEFKRTIVNIPCFDPEYSIAI